jgi:diguanylate cyclase (GGDEF)-like protein
VPLLAQGELVGVLNVESASETPLDERDLRLLVTVADRLAVAVALGRERQAVDERARLFRGLTEFAARIGGTLQADALYATIVEVVGEALPGSISVLTVIEPATGRYLIRSGAESVGAPGIEIRPGEGIAGRAIRDRTIVAVERFGRDDAPAELRDRLPHDLAMAAAGAPLVREGAVIGALTVLRPGDPFSPTELEVIDLLARQAALAVANTLLHAEIADLAIRDPLTGLFNRRHFDAALDRLIAAHLRRPPKQRALSVILFDLDEFGAFNKLHGHQAGDAVLRAFGELLAGRFRASDVVARYGGEEFVVVLDGAPREAALEVAEEVRTRFEALEIEGPDGPLRATVSAGCAALDETTRTREALLRAADVGLFMAKRAGRNRVVAA